MEMNTIWWDKVPKAARFVQDTVDAVIAGKNITLILPENIPWRKTFYRLVEQKAEEAFSNKSLSVLTTPQGPVDVYVFQRFCKEEKRLEYRPHKSRAQFLAERDDIVLHDQILWIRALLPEDFAAWSDFVSDYYRHRKKAASSAVFILETASIEAGKKAKSGLQQVIYDNAIDSFDTYAFLIIAASEITEQRGLRHYFAALLAGICDRDVELCAACLRHGRRFLLDPAGVLQVVCTQETRSDGSAFAAAEHLDKQIWKAQLKMIFPVIEDYREGFINQYRTGLEQLGKIPEDEEIGALYYYAVNRQLHVSTADLQDLQRFREARNTLAHLKILPLAEVEWLLKRVHSLREVNE